MTPNTVLDITQNDNTATRVGDKLKGRVAFVTGGTRGIGAAICRSLASQGATLAAGYAGNDEAAKKFRDGFAAIYRTPATVHKGNVGDPNDCRRTIDEVIAAHGRLDVLVNNAGITIDKTVLKLSDEDWFKVLNVNLSGAFHMIKEVIGPMAARKWGRIINVSSVAALGGLHHQVGYAASKAGLLGLTKTVTLEHARDGITCNAVGPSPIRTRLLEGVPEEKLQAILARQAVKRWASECDVINVIEFFLRPESSLVTGQVVYLGGIG